MAEDYSRELLRRAVAQICRLLGWHAIRSSPLAVLAHVLEKYLVTIAGGAHRYAEHDLRTEPNLDDLFRAFGDLDVGLSELRAYARAVPPRPPPRPTPEYPRKKECSLNFLKPGSREVVTRPAHVPDHLPPMRPESELEPDDAADDPAAPSAGDPFKRPGEPAPAALKKPKRRPDEERHARELSSVMMTASGFLSPAREGRLPEARTPIVAADAPPERPRPRPFAATPAPATPAPAPETERADGKLKRRALNGKIDGPKKRDRRRAALDPPFSPGDPRPRSTAPRAPAPRPPPGGRPGGPPPPRAPATAPVVLPPPTPTPLPEFDARNIKKEPVEETKPPVRDFAPVPVPVPPTAFPPPADLRPGFAREPPPNAKIKEEKIDGKLASRPDKSKLDIFKKISAKVKEERPPAPAPAPAPEPRPVEPLRNVTIKVEKKTPPPSPRDEPEDAFAPRIADGRPPDPFPKRETVPPFAFAPDRPIKTEPADERPEETVPDGPAARGVPISPIAKEKRERKKKERRTKGEKISKIREGPARARGPSDGGPYGVPEPPAFPFLSLTPGLIPNRGLVPPEPFPGGSPFAGPNLLPNPFSRGFPAFLPPNAELPGGLSFSSLAVDRGFGAPPRMPRPPNLPPYLRRPSLEVIPIDADDGPEAAEPPRFVPEIAERPRARLPPIDRFAPGGLSITSVPRRSPPRSNPIIPVPPVRPDVTIEVNESVPRPPREPSPPVGLPEPPPFLPRDEDRSEKKKERLRKKEKRDREQKIKKKKDKKEKLRLKLEKKREKSERQESKERTKKEKREKRKERERRSPAPGEGLVPKLTLKLGSSSPAPSSPDPAKRLNIKPIIKKEEDADDGPPPERIETGRSPELAKISALVTRPPKSKSSKRGASARPEPNPDSNSASPTSRSDVSPVRKVKPPSSMKYKRIHFKPIPKRNSGDFEDPVIDLESEDMEIGEPPLPERVPNLPLGTPYYVDSEGNKIWVCPACNRPDNGTPMIACDGCDGWYHWVCVGIQVEPANTEDWYCTGCRAKRTAMASAMAAGQTVKKRGRKPKADKMKETH